MQYKVAQEPEDFKAAKKLLLAEGFPDQEIGFPTVMAWKDGELIGFITTTPDPEMVVGGPMVMRGDKQRVFTSVRLVELYEQYMLSLGITSVIFYADEKESPFVRGVRRWFPSVQPYAKKGSLLFYNWKLNDKSRRSA